MRIALCALALTLVACGSASGEKPKSTVLLMPGSGYRGADEFDGERMAIGETTWRRWGFRVKTVGYGPGKTGRDDVVTAVHAWVKRHPKARLCLYGESSGGTWAMVAAASEPGVACVLAGAAPADEDTWLRAKRGPAFTFAHRIWPAYFGTGAEDDAFEPYDVWRAKKPDVPLFLVAARGDPTVPPDQGGVMNRLPHTRLRVLRSGDAHFVHSDVDATQLGRVQKELRAFARGAS